MLPCARSSLKMGAVEGHRGTVPRFWNHVPEVWGLFGEELSRRWRARSGRISRPYEVSWIFGWSHDGPRASRARAELRRSGGMAWERSSQR
jgi:hypothetical protein